MATETAGRAKDYKEMIREAVSCGETFLRLTMSGGIRGESIPWTKAVVRPVELRDERHYQFIYYDHKKGLTKNYSGVEFPQRLEALLSMPFRLIHVQTTSGDLHIRITKKGKCCSQKLDLPELNRGHIWHTTASKIIRFPGILQIDFSRALASWIRLAR